jgi:hypothetical protein
LFIVRTNVAETCTESPNSTEDRGEPTDAIAQSDRERKPSRFSSLRESVCRVPKIWRA